MGEQLNGSSNSASPRKSWTSGAEVGDALAAAPDSFFAERRLAWFDGCIEGLFRIDLLTPLNLDQSETLAIYDLLAQGFIQECNGAMLSFLNADAIHDVVGTTVQSHKLLTSVSAHFIRNGCRLQNYLVEAPGGKSVLVSAMGGYDTEGLLRIWGRCRHQSIAEKIAVLDALESQKQQIGLELHDGIGQLLTALRITSQDIADSLRHQPENHISQLSLQLSEEAEEALELLRKITTNLSPAAILRGDTLKSALEVLVARTCRVASVDCRLEWNGEIRIADDQIRIHAYRIVQEALTNALKHSQADAIMVVGREKTGGLDLMVKDNGVGFRRENRVGESIGIESLHYRAAVIGADLSIRSTEAGTEVSCFIPRHCL